MAPKNKKMFCQWLEKIRAMLESADKSAANELPNSFRYLKYWADKLRVEQPKDFATIEKEYVKTSCEVGEKIHVDNLEFLKSARKHGKGTKSRFTKILQYVYHYGNYNHDCFIEGGQEAQAKRILSSFWDSFGKEIMDNKDMLSAFQVDALLSLAKQSKNVGVEICPEWLEYLEDAIRPLDPFLIDQVKNQIETAEENLLKEETIAALILADQALELFIRELCVRFDCEEDTLSKRGLPFLKWGFTDYVNFLSKNKKLNQYEKATLYRIHQWRNSSHHLGLEPSVRIVRNVINEISDFLEAHSY